MGMCRPGGPRSGMSLVMLSTFLCVWTRWPGPQPRAVTSWQWQEEVGHPWAGGFGLALGAVLALDVILALALIPPLWQIQ